MQFLKQNLFLIALAGGVVILGGLLLVLGSGWTKDIEAQFEKRQAVSADLRPLRGAPYVNNETVGRQRQRAEGMATAVERVRQWSIEQNRNGYEVMQLPVRGEDGTRRVIPAFPMEEHREEYRYGARYTATQVYREELASLLELLTPTAPPTDSEIQAEVQLARQRLRDQLAREGGAAPPPGTPRPGDFNPGGPTGRAPGDPGQELPPELTQQAQEEGTLAARVRAASRGLVYAQLDNLDVYFAVERGDARDTELWESQINLWIQQDIVNAIRQTNAEVLGEGADALPVSVMNAAVKQLVSIDVTEQYVLPAGASPGPGGRAGGTWGAPQGPSLLTGETSEQEYDVVRYSFTVVMPTRHLPALMRNLQAQAYYKVTRTDLRRPEPEEMPAYFYGTDPVMVVTIQGEQLLLTEWERGTYDSSAQAWSEQYPPLIPVAVLKLMPSNILRQADSTRVREAGP